MAEPLVIANTWLSTTLKASVDVAALVGSRVYGEDIPPGVAYPVVLFEWLPGTESAITHDGIRVIVTLTYRVRGIVTDQSPAAIAGNLATAIHEAIHRQGGPAAGGNVWECQWADPYQRYETLPERRYRHLGGSYDLIVSG